MANEMRSRKEIIKRHNMLMDCMNEAEGKDPDKAGRCDAKASELKWVLKVEDKSQKIPEGKVK